jgi:uncharacterized membrane protein (DUF2068 family)
VRRVVANDNKFGEECSMSDPTHVPAILEKHRRVRYLKLIALFKIAKGAVLLLLGFSLLFLTSLKTQPLWLGQISDWADDQLLLHHTKVVHFLLNKLQYLMDALAGGRVLRATGLLSLFYCAVLFTEGLGVYFQKRWAERLMIYATGALIPLELRHLWHQIVAHQSFIIAAAILLVNCFIVWFLYLVLKREKPEPHFERKAELVETR